MCRPDDGEHWFDLGAILTRWSEFAMLWTSKEQLCCSFLFSREWKRKGPVRAVVGAPVSDAALRQARDGLKEAFLTGGGSQVAGYGTSVKSAGERHARMLNLMPLPLHPRLADFTGGNSEYQRISVACGLALDAFSLGQIVPAKDLHDDVALRKQVAERPDRDELYPH